MKPTVLGTSESKPKVELPKILILDDHYRDQFLPITISNKGTTKNDAISVEQYSDEDRDLNIALMASLKSNKDASSKGEKPLFVNLDDHYRDQFLPITISNNGTAKNDAISVEQYSDEDRDLNIALMASLKSNKDASSKGEKPLFVNLDDYNPIALSNKGGTLNNPFSVEEHSEDRELNIAIKASLNSYKSANSVDLSQEHFYYYDDANDEIKVLDSMPQVTTSRLRKEPAFRDTVTENGQSSKSQIDPDVVCEICVEPTTLDKLFSIKVCNHAYCTDCMIKYVASKLQENISKICCPVPDCKGVLEPQDCRSILPEDVFDRWGNALCEAVILGSHKFYCPFKDCSAMLIDDGGQVIRESECPNCRRMFCAHCKVPWHPQISCEEFKMLHKDEREKDDLLLMNLAKDKNWRRCPKCRIFVERITGCRFMKCRCGTHFCYGCGSTELNPQTHVCYKCNTAW